MTSMLPSTVEELNLLQNSMDPPSPTLYNNGLECILIEKQQRFKREYSLPTGVDWNIHNFEAYLNFEENLEGFKAIESMEDRLVPENGDQRQYTESFSSVPSSMEVHNFGLKTFNTVCMDSGSTCISTASDHTYVSPSIFKGLEAEETYQNLDLFLQQVPEMTITENLPSPISSSDSNFELSALHSSFSLQDSPSSSSVISLPTKRPVETSSEDELYGTRLAKRLCDSPPTYTEVRRKNNVASKNCRKTRKEKQKEMEIRVAELEKEKDELKVEVQLLEELIQSHKMQLYAILQKR